MKKERRTPVRRRAPAEPRTLDEAALLLLQLDAGQVKDLRILSRGLRKFAAEVGVESVRAHAIAAADAVDAAISLSGDEAAATLGRAGQELEAAMNAAEDVAVVPPSRPAPDPMAWALEALAEIDARDSAEAKAAAATTSIEQARAVPATAAGSVLPGTLPEDVDIELLEGFVAESVEYLQGAEAALLELEADPTNTEAVNTVFRCFHTIKGTAAFMGLERLSELAHRAESLLSRVRDGEIVLAGEVAELALRSADALGDMVASVGSSLGGAPLRLPDGYAALMQALADAEVSAAGGAAAPASQHRTGGTAPAAIAGCGAAAAATAAHGASAAPAAHDAQAGGSGVVPAAAPQPAAGGRTHDPAHDSWMRVRTDRVDRLVDTIGELVIAHSMIAQDDIGSAARGEELARKVAHAAKIVRELQDLSISMRMVPLKAQFQKLARVVRDVAVRSGKRVEFVTEGEETEIDRNMVDIIGDPLIHMIRNAIDHGIESQEERERSGKPATATVRLSAFHAGGAVVVQLSDDGRGLDRRRIMEKAVARGLVEVDRHLSDREIDALIFTPGFSTAEQVTDLSGRGVGMDVVRRNIESLRGHVDIESRPGRGVTFTIRLPLTLALTDGMLVRVGRERYIIPTTSIQMSFRPETAALSTVVGRGEIVMLRGAVLPIVRLHRLFDVTDAVAHPADGLLVVIAAGEQRCALLIDELLGQQQVVTKTLGAGIGKVAGLSGGAILGDGRVGLIIDPAEIIALSRAGASAAAA